MPLVDRIEDYTEQLPTVLYKFRIWDSKSHKNVLFNQEVYFSPVNSFIDESDCKFPVKFPSSYQDLSNWLDSDHETLVNRYPFERDRARYKQSRISFLQGPLGQEEMKNTFYSQTNAVLGVLSLTGRTDNTKMWESNYANNFDGFCIGFNPQLCIKELIDNHIFGAKCDYVSVDEPAIPYVSPTLNPELSVDFALEVIRRKYDQFSFEEEYRLVKLFLPELHPTGITSKDRLFQIPKHAYTEIVVGCNMPEHSIQEIIQVCRDQGINVLTKMASPDGFGGISYSSI